MNITTTNNSDETDDLDSDLASIQSEVTRMETVKYALLPSSSIEKQLNIQVLFDELSNYLNTVTIEFEK